jgi:hypothetical protein
MKIRAPFYTRRTAAGLKLLAWYVRMVRFDEVDAEGQIGKRAVWRPFPRPLTQLRSLGYIK